MQTKPMIKTAISFQTVTSRSSMFIWPPHSTLQFTSTVEIASLSNPPSPNNYMHILTPSSISLPNKYSVPYFKQAVRRVYTENSSKRTTCMLKKCKCAFGDLEYSYVVMRSKYNSETTHT
jgi:hypothetical protein